MENLNKDRKKWNEIKILSALGFLFLSIVMIGIISYANSEIETYNPQSSEAGSIQEDCDHIVNKDGSDDFKTINEALKAASANQKICVKEGVYNEVITISKPGVELTAYDLTKRPVIDGDTDGSGDGFFELPEGKGQDNDLGEGRAYNYRELVTLANKDITFSYFVVQNSRGDGVSIHSETNPLTNIHMHHNIVRYTMVNNLSVHGAGSKYGTDTSDTIVENNTFEYASQYPRYGGENWPGAIGFAGSNDMTFRNNLIRYSWGDGILLDSNWQRSKNIIIEGNVMYDTKVAMMYIHASDNAIIRNNFFFTTPSNPTQKTPNWSCIHFQAQENESYKVGGAHGISGTKVYNNIVWGCRVSLGFSTQAPESYIRDVDIYNNTFVNNGPIDGWTADAGYVDVNFSSGNEESQGIIESIKIENNLFAHLNKEDHIPVYIRGSIGGTKFRNNYWSVIPDNINSTTAIGDVPHELRGADGNGSFPPFEDPPSLDQINDAKQWFNLKNDAPAIDKSNNSYLLRVDFNMYNRDKTADIGAFEYDSKPTINPDYPDDPPPKDDEPPPDDDGGDEEPPPDDEPPPDGQEGRDTDVNSDGAVNMLDISRVLSVWGEEADASVPEDVNNDQIIDMLDISLIISDWD